MRIYCCTIRKRLHVLGPLISAARDPIDLSRQMQTLCAFRAQSGSNPRLKPKPKSMCRLCLHATAGSAVLGGGNLVSCFELFVALPRLCFSL